jgi:hypothetical protein
MENGISPASDPIPKMCGAPSRSIIIHVAAPATVPNISLSSLPALLDCPRDDP